MNKLIILMFFFVLSCNSHGNTPLERDVSNNDSESLDKIETEDFEKEDEIDLSKDMDFSKDIENHKDSEEKNDEDSLIQRPENCPKLKDANFPYYRADGTITFCRKCDLPADPKDPDCVRNLWKNANKRYSTDYPNDDCYGYPCFVDKLKPVKNNEEYAGFQTKCDLSIAPAKYSTPTRDGKIARLHDGKLGLRLTYLSDFNYSSGRGFEFDIKTQKYKVLMPAEILTYYKGNMLGVTYDHEKARDFDTYKDAETYLIYYDKNKGYKLAYPKSLEIMSDSSITMNDKWAFIVISEKHKGPQRLYAKIGEWKWHKIGAELEENPLVSISGDKLAIYNDKYPLRGYICDLSKYPEKYSECDLINRDIDKNIWAPKFNKKDGNRLVYGSVRGEKNIFTVLELKNGKKVYTDYEIPREPYSTDIQIDEFVGDLVLYDDLLLYGSDYSYPYDGRFCFYNIKEKKSYCFKKDFKNQEYIHQYYGDFDGRYVIWDNGEYMRDMKCYCKLEPSLCPIEEFRR